MFDNYYTKYKDAKYFINEKTAEEICQKLLNDVKNKNMTAEKYAYLSKAYTYMQDDKHALETAKMAVRLDKSYAYGYIRLAFTYGRLGKRKEAENAAVIAERLGADNWFICAFLINIFAWLDEYEKAECYLNKIESLNIETPDYYYSLGFSFGCPQIKEYEKAVYYFKKAEEKGYKNYYDLIYKMMIIFGKLCDSENTEIYLNKCLEYGETEDLLERKIQLALYKETPEEVINDIRHFYRLTEDKQQALIYLAKASQQKGQLKKALKYLRFAQYSTEPTLFLFYQMAVLYELQSDFKNAVICYKKALKFDKNDEDILLGLSYCYSNLKENELAELYVDKVLLLEPDEPYPYYRKGNLCCDLKRYDEAAEFYKKALELDPSDVDYYGSVSYAYSKVEKYDLSLEYANRGIMVNKNDCYVHFRKGWALQELGKYDSAIKAYQNCIDCNESYVDAYANISSCYSKMGEMKKSMIYANKAILVNKDYAYAHYRKAWGLHYLGQFEEAKESYETALELDPTDQYSYIGLAATSLDLRESMDALKAANKAIMLDRNCGEAYYFKGLALSYLGKLKEAQISYAKAASLGYS